MERNIHIINTLLLNAARNEDWITARRFLEEGADPNATDENGLRPIDFALRQANLGAIDLLLDYGASVENVHGISPLVVNGESGWIAIKLAHGYDGLIYARKLHTAERRVDSLKNFVDILHFFGIEAPAREDGKDLNESLMQMIGKGTANVGHIERWIKVCGGDVESIKRVPRIEAIYQNGFLIGVWFPRGDGVVVYLRRGAHLLGFPVTPVEKRDEPVLIGNIINKVFQNFRLTINSRAINTKGSQKRVVPEKSNDAEVRHDHATEVYTEPERCAVPALNEATSLVLERESLAEAKEKKAKKHCKAHRRKWSSRDGDAKQLNFFDELGFENVDSKEQIITDKNENRTKSIVLGLKHPEGRGDAEKFCRYLREAGVENVEFIDCTKLMRFEPYVCYDHTHLSNFLANTHGIRAVYCPIMQNSDRNILLSWARELGYETPNFIHPSAKIDPTEREKLDQNPNAGIYVFEGAEIEPNVDIEDFTIIARNVRIDQGVKIGTAVFISSWARLGKNCTVCNYTHVDGNVPVEATVAGDPMRFLESEKKCSE